MFSLTLSARYERDDRTKWYKYRPIHAFDSIMNQHYCVYPAMQNLYNDKTSKENMGHFIL